MENIFLTFFNLSINAGWLVLAVILLRQLLKKAPKWVHCVLWSIVGLRLVLPFSFESVFSLLPSRQFIAPSTLYEMSPTVDSGFNIVNEIINPVFSEALASSPENSVNPLQIITIITSHLWVVGIIIMCLYTLFTYVSLKRKVSTATKLTDNVYQSENVPSPFILGVIKPKIYLPYAIDEKDADYVIAHEKAHLKRKDHLIKPLAFLLLSLYWFNPLLWLAYILLCRDIELSCDEKVVKEYDKEECKEYSYALLNCSINRKRIAACPLAFGEVGVKDRIKNVLSYKKPAFWVILAGVIACIITAVCFLTVPRGVTLTEGYLYEPLSSPKASRLEIGTPENAYIFTDKKQIDVMSELIDGIRVNKRITEEYDYESTDFFPEPSYVIKGIEGDVQFFELCISRDFKHIWKSEEGQCQYLFTSRDADKVRSILTTDLNMAFIRQQIDELVSELLVDYFAYPQVRDSVFTTESHYVIKENINYSSDNKLMPESVTMFMIYNCSAFRYSGYTVKNIWTAQGVCEFDFDIKDGRVIYKDMTEHVRGADAHLADFGSTEEIDKQLEKAVFEKAKKHFGVGTTLNEEPTTSLPQGDLQSGDPDVYALSSVDFTYDIVPVYPFPKKYPYSNEFEKLVRDKSLNSSHLIRNENKQVYDGQYCLIYRETDAENLITDYAAYIDINEKGEGLTSLSEVRDKYEKIKDEKDMYVVYIPDMTGDNRYNVTDFLYHDGCMTAEILSFPSDPIESYWYWGYFAVIYVPKNVALYKDFTAIMMENPTIIVGNTEINLSDIDSMNIGAEMPKIHYCEDGMLIMSGTFGLIIYDIDERKITDRLDYRVLNKLGIDFIECDVSFNGARVYIGNADVNFDNKGTFTPLFTYHSNSKSLYACGDEYKDDILYDKIANWNYNGNADIPQKGYIYSTERRHDEKGGCYLRAKADWSMKSLQAVIYDHNGTTEIIDIFG